MMGTLRPWVSMLLWLMGAALCAAALLSGSPLIERPVIAAIPLGNLLAAALFACLGAAPLPLTAGGRVLRRLAWAVLCFALSWLPVSMLLAGNVALNFASGRGDLWGQFSVAVFAAAIAMLVLSIAYCGLRHGRGSEAR